MAYNANLSKKRFLQEASDAVPVEPAAKGKAVEPGSYSSSTPTAVAASTRVPSFALPSRPLSPRPIFNPIFEDALPQNENFSFAPTENSEKRVIIMTRPQKTVKISRIE